MKKVLVIILFMLGTVLAVQAQDNKRVWFDISLQQNIELNDWYDNKDLNYLMPRIQTPNLKVKIGWDILPNWGVFGDVSFGMVSYKKGFDKTNMLGEFDTGNYYISDMWHRDNSDDKVRGLITLGSFYKFRYNKWDFIPYLGIGFDEACVPFASYTAKEKGSNNKYKVFYEWMGKQLYDESNIKKVALSLELVAAYKLRPNTHITFGINYRYSLYKAKFKAVVSDYYDQSFVREIPVEGNNLQTLGISVGIRFGR